MVALRLNSESTAVSGAMEFGTVIARYEQEEMPERYSTRAAYQSYINNGGPGRAVVVSIEDIASAAAGR